MVRAKESRITGILERENRMVGNKVLVVFQSSHASEYSFFFFFFFFASEYSKAILRKPNTPERLE